jgi:hypothetical protein
LVKESVSKMPTDKNHYFKRIEINTQKMFIKYQFAVDNEKYIQ